MALAAASYAAALTAEPATDSFSRSLADVPSAAVRPDSRHPYFLEATLNGHSSGLILSCELRGDDWWAPVKELRNIGLRVDDLPPGADGWVNLSAVPGLGVRYEAAGQRLHLTVLAARRNTHVVRNAPTAHPGDAAHGALLNYDAIAERLHGDTILRAFTEQRLFGEIGVFSNSGVHTATENDRDYIRHESVWTHANPETLRSLSVGDVISRSLTWNRSVRLGGAQFGRNFALRPDLVTYPVAEFSGEAAVPSTVDVYVNQVRQLSSDLPAGPFRIETPPALNGAGQATLVVRDALGRETVQTLDLYVVPQLLASGLSDYSVEAGLLRRNFGLLSDDYRPGMVGSASLRYGASDAITLESHAEAADGLSLLGGGALMQLGNLGRLNLWTGFSDADRGGDTQGIGYQYVAPRFSFTADWQQADADYRDLASLAGEPPGRRQARVFVGTQLHPTIHLSAAYLDVESASESRIASLGYRQTLGRHVSIAANAFRDLERDGSSGIYVAVSMALGRGVHFQSDYSSDDERSSLTLAGRSPYELGWDWGLRASRVEDTDSQARVQYTGDSGTASLEFVEQSGEDRWQVGGRGALTVIDGTLLTGRYVQDEFAVVSTNGIAGVPVLHENRPVGRTNAGGYLMLANVNAYQANRIAIDPLEVPFGYLVDRTGQTAIPRLLSGTLVRFPIEESRGVLLTIVDERGMPLPAGSRGINVDGGGGFIVGYDGAAFLPELREFNRIRVETASGACIAEFPRPPDDEAPREIGPVACR